MRTKRCFLVLCVLALLGCTYNIKITQQDVATWANNIYNAQYDDYLSWFTKNAEGTLVLKPNVPTEQKAILVAKKKIFMELQPLLIVYSSYVETGAVPTGMIIGDVEARLVTLVNTLIKEGAK